jgi:hypothetical protein
VKRTNHSTHVPNIFGSVGDMTTPTPIIDPTKFYTRSTPPKEDAVEVEVIVPTEVVEAIRLLARDDRFPDYETPEDFMRDAMAHELHAAMIRATDPALKDRIAADPMATGVR